MSLTPEQAWQSALGQLQMEMPKSSFDTWVKDSCLVSYQDGRFVVGVRNVYAREWLDARLSSTVSRLLMGMMNQEVSVQFVVSDADLPHKVADQEQDDGTLENQGTAEADRSDQVEVEAHYDLAYDEIVVPEHVTLVPRYFLRHLRRIGPDLGWLYMGFRQAAFNAGGRSGSKRERFTGKAIAGLSGITERTFWNKIKDANTWERLQGLVTTTQATPEWDTSSASPRRLPRRYVVAMTLPLTAEDAHSLRAFLTDNLSRMGKPETLIQAAILLPLDTLLPPDAMSREDDKPESVISILHSLFGKSIPAERLAALATRLHKHIMPDNDRLAVTHFFVEHILPYLGTGPGWMLTLLRDRCYVNRETGEVRDQVRIAGGYDEIASWLGLVRSKTIWEWLHAKHSASRGRSKVTGKGGQQSGPGRQAKEIGELTNPILRVYLGEVELARSSQSLETAPRTFQVLLDEIPTEILEIAFDEKASRKLVQALAAEGDNHAVCSIGMARFAEDDGAVCSIAVARFAEDIAAVCRVFKSLNPLNQIPNDSSSPLPPSNVATRKPEPGVGSPASWDLDFLLTNNQVAIARKIRNQQKLTGARTEQLALGFVSWLLYAYSPSGQRVKNPVSLAAKRLMKDFLTGAGGDYDRLAELGPFELKAIFGQDLAGTLWKARDSIEKEIYTLNYKDLIRSRKQELYRRLFGWPK